jgi:hypothetical protein
MPIDCQLVQESKTLPCTPIPLCHLHRLILPHEIYSRAGVIAAYHLPMYDQIQNAERPRGLYKALYVEQQQQFVSHKVRVCHLHKLDKLKDIFPGWNSGIAWSYGLANVSQFDSPNRLGSSAAIDQFASQGGCIIFVADQS